jgi:hypothetical protein
MLDGHAIAASLAADLRRTGELAKRLQAGARQKVDPHSLLGLDDAAAVVGDHSKAIASYVQNRAGNAARFAQEVADATTARVDGKLHLNFTVLYPLLRGALEDAGTLMWLRSPADGSARILRSLRLLREDGMYFASNHLLLAKAATGRADIPAGLAEALRAHMQAEMDEIKSHFDEIADLLGYPAKAVSAAVPTSLPLKEHFGAEDLSFVIWKLLSDLSHFSYSLTRHFSSNNEYVEQTNDVVTFRVMIQTVNTALADAADLLDLSLEREGRST